MEPSLHRLTLPITLRATEIIDSMQLVLVRVFANRPDTPRWRTVKHVPQPLPQGEPPWV
jgi:hypothetical protein